MLLPNTNLEVSPLCLGAADFGTRLGPDDTVALIETFLSGGGNFLDTAHVYAIWTENGLGASEAGLGEAIKRLGVREQVVIATKGGHPDAGDIYPRPADFLAPELIARDVSESLERLQIDQIDLYYLHRDDGKTPVGEVMESLNALVDAGKIRSLGASNWSVERVAVANEWAKLNKRAGFVALQNQWSLAVPSWKPTADPTVRAIGAADVEKLRRMKLTVIPYSATANGYFASDEEWVGAFGSENAGRRSRAKMLGQKLGVSPTQVALAWLMGQPLSVVPLFSTTKIAHLKEAMGAMEVEIDEEDAEWLVTG